MLSRLITRKEQLVLLALAGAISVGSLVLYFHRDAPIPPTDPSPAQPNKDTAKPPSHPPAPAARASTPTTPAPAPVPVPAPSFTVSITGAVRKPGVYTLDGDARVNNLIEKAGGVTDTANVSGLNLAAKLLDGTTLTVPAKPLWDAKTRQWVYPEQSYNPPQYTLSGWANAQPAAAAAPGPANKGGESAAINLNTATQQQLESLPGIGPKLAQQIIAQRTSAPFQTVDDLDKVPGIGPRRIEQIRGLVTAP